MSKFKNAPHNKSEQSFRDLLKLPCMDGVKKQFIHDFKNLCHHSNIGNIFANQFIKPNGKVELVRSGVACEPIVTVSLCWEDEYDSFTHTELDGVSVELTTNRLHVHRAFLVLSADPVQDKFTAAIQVRFKDGIKATYSVPYDKLKEVLIVALG